MKSLALLTFFVAFLGCGPDRNLIMETKFDASLRQRVASLEEGDTETLDILGKCSDTIDGMMQQAIIEAGADVETMNGDVFTAKVSSDDVYSVAALEFVTRIQLFPMPKMLRK